MSVKSKKSMLKMSRLSPQVKALEAKYGDDKQKYQLAVQQMHKEEGVSMGGGCLWSFIPLLILLPLYNVIREPITYMMHNSRSISEAIVAFLQASGEILGKNAYYALLAAAGHIGDYADTLQRLCNEHMVKKFVKKYQDDPTCADLHNAVLQQDWEAAFRGAHTLKGVAQNLGFERLYQGSAVLTEAMRGNKPLEDRSLLDAVEQQDAAIRRAISELE